MEAILQRTSRDKEGRPSWLSWRALVLGGALVLGRFLGPGAVPALALAAILAPVVGALCSWRELALTLVPCALWFTSESPANPAGALLALAALSLLGRTVADVWQHKGRAACGLCLLGLALTLAPSFLHQRGQGLGPLATARLLELSPVTLVAECAGVDWLRHPAVYEPCGGDAIGPDLHRPLGLLAAGVPALLGCLLGLLAVWRRHRASSCQEPP